jgi:hypothetical protein
MRGFGTTSRLLSLYYGHDMIGQLQLRSRVEKDPTFGGRVLATEGLRGREQVLCKLVLEGRGTGL